MIAAAPRATAEEGRATRPRLLFLCQTLPFPPDGGVQIRTWNVLRLLARDFDVTALCFHRAADRPTEADVRASVEGVRAVAEVEAFPIPQERSRLRLAADHLRSVAGRRAYTVFAYESRPFRARLDALLRTRRFDLAHVDSLDLSAYLPALGGLPVVCVHHNVESALLRRRAAGEPRRAVAAYLRHQAALVEREERRWLPRVALNVAVSEDDRAALERLAPGARCVVVPNGVDTSYFAPAAGDDGILFVGGTTWFPNADAMRHFCADVLPLLRARGVDAPVRWVGRAGADVRAHYRDRHGVEMTGYVDDVRPHLARAACFVVPLRVGGGTRLKILDAWAAGKAVVSTSVGCEGLDARDGENLLVRDDPAAFAAAVHDVLRDPSLRRRLGEGARRTARETYDWEAVGARMRAAYRALLPAPARAGCPLADGVPMPILRTLAKRTALLLPPWLLAPIKARHYTRAVAAPSVDDEPDLRVVAHLVGPGDTALDLGANVGVYTRFLSGRVGPAGRVASVEPVPETFSYLVRTVRALGLANVTPQNVAVSGAEGWAEMETPRFDWGGDNHYMAHVVTNGADDADGAGRRIRVRTVTADSIAGEMGAVDFVKMDVEGHELSVLDGAVWLLREARPAWLIEVSGDPDDAEGGAARLFARMAEAGYRAWRFADGRLARRAAGDRSVNYFFLTDGQAEALRARAPELF